MHFDQMSNVLQTSIYIFLHIPKQKVFQKAHRTNLDFFLEGHAPQNQSRCLCQNNYKSKITISQSWKPIPKTTRNGFSFVTLDSHTSIHEYVLFIFNIVINHPEWKSSIKQFSQFLVMNKI
jgi:hypothetical protein